MMKKRIPFLLLATIPLLYYLYKEIRWRYYNDNSLRVEVSSDLDIKYVKIVWSHYMRDLDIFKDGELKNTIPSIPNYWTIGYKDLGANIFKLGNESDDYRRDFDYTFKFFKENDTVKCELLINNKTVDITNLNR